MSKHLVLFLFTLGLSGQLLSQQTQEIVDTIEAPLVVVTQSKVPTTIKETVKPIEVITQQMIQENLGKDLSQILQQTSGIIVNGAYSNPGKDKSTFINGAGNGLTLFLINGQPIIDPSSINGSFDLRLFPLNQVERIEILRGSQSTLYGSNAIGGVINIITKQTTDEPISINGNLAYGSLNTFNGSLGIRGKTKPFGYNVSVTNYRTDGISEAFDNDPTVTFDEDGIEVWSTQASLDFQVNDKLSISPFFRLTDYEGDFDGGSFDDADNTYSSDWLNSGVNARYQSDKWKANFDYGFISTDRIFNTTFGVSEFQGRFHNAEAWVSRSINSKFEILGGINFQANQMLDTTGAEIDPDAQIISPFVNLLGHFNGFNTELGVRYNNHSEFGGNANVSAAVSYVWNSGFKVFANYTTGFKAPDLFQLYGSFLPNPDLSPQTSAYFSAGIQFGTSQDPVFARLSYFNRRVDELIAFNFVNGYINQDEQNDQGINLEVGWNPSKKLALNAQYNYVTGEITTPLDATRDTTFNNLIRQPEHAIKANITYRPTTDLALSLQMQYLGERNDLFFNPENGFAAEDVILDSFFLANFYAQYHFSGDKFSIFADLKNITDTDFVESFGFGTIGFNALFGVRFSL